MRDIQDSSGDPAEAGQPGVVAPADGASGAAVALSPPYLRLRSEAGADRGRGWLLHRALLVADLCGLGLAFFLAQLFFEPPGSTRDVVSPGVEALVFALSLPIWILIAKL